MECYLWILIFIGVFALGFLCGQRVTDDYWESHVEDQSCICHKGKFYRVLTESRTNELMITENKYNFLNERMTNDQ